MMNSTKDLTQQKYDAVGKLVVDKGLEEQIRHLCVIFPDKEWSGVLFYTIKGSIESKDVEINAVDFFLMDIGTGGATDFELGNSPDIARFMVTHKLFDCHTGLLHSHNSMSSFFSGVDSSTLKQEGATMPNFVSLVVNNAGQYVAAITSKEEHTYQIKETGKRLYIGGRFVNLEEKTYTKTDSKVSIYGLDVYKEVPELNELDARVEELREAKKSKVTVTGYSGYINPYIDDDDDYPYAYLRGYGYESSRNEPNLFSGLSKEEETIDESREAVKSARELRDKIMEALISAPSFYTYEKTNAMFRTKNFKGIFDSYKDEDGNTLMLELKLNKGEIENTNFFVKIATALDLEVLPLSDDIENVITAFGFKGDVYDFILNTVTRFSKENKLGNESRSYLKYIKEVIITYKEMGGIV